MTWKCSKYGPLTPTTAVQEECWVNCLSPAPCWETTSCLVPWKSRATDPDPILLVSELEDADTE